MLTATVLTGTERAARASGAGAILDSKISRSPYLEIEPLNISIIQRGKVRGQLQVMVSLELTDPTRKMEMKSKTPVIRDAYITSLTQYAAGQLDYRSAVDVPLLKWILQRATDSVIEPGQGIVLISLANIFRQKNTKEAK